MRIDLHTHSNVSDGVYSPEDLVIRAKELGLDVLAVSDHDTVEGSRRAMIKGEEVGITIIPAVEISTSLDGHPLHMLAYGIDLENQELIQTLKNIEEYRIARAQSIVENINKELTTEGKPLLNLDAILALGKEKPLTRPDIAHYLIQNGYVETREEAFQKWLNKFNIPHQELNVAQVCTLVHAAGGVAVLAHPNSEFLSLNTISTEFKEHQRMIIRLKDEGLDGIEAYRPSQSPDNQAKYAQFADSIGLIVTGGSDYHGEYKDREMGKIGSAAVPDEVMAELEAAITRVRNEIVTSS